MEADPVKQGNRHTPMHPNDGMVRVRGAREHNLKNVDVDIPRDALVVFFRRLGLGQVFAGVRYFVC